MNPFTLLIILALAAILVPACAWAYRQLPAAAASARLMACNIGEGTHADSIPLASDAAHGRHILVTTLGASDREHYDICAAAEEPLGACPDEVAAADVGELRSIRLLSRGGTVKLVASEAITVGEWVYTAAAGKVQDEPAEAGTYYRVGRALTAAGADGDLIEVETIAPIKLVVVAAFTSTNGTAAAASASLANLAAEAEKIGDDVRALGTALAEPALVKVLAA